jgi:O-acetyl-ADP-ribose deacetylase (regulator of RNase III)
MIAIDEVMHFLSAGSGATVERVFFVCYDEENYALYESIIAERS